MNFLKRNRFVIGLLLAVFCASPPAKAESAVRADRWVEIDLYWFQRDDLKKSAEVFWDRYHPLFNGVEGWKGVILDIGWVGDYVFQWRGDLNQKIWFLKGLHLTPGFKADGLLEGTTMERMEKWKLRFKDAGQSQIASYEEWTYGDLQKLIQTLKEVAREKYRLSDIKVGSLVIDAINMYRSSEASPFVTRHPNVSLTEPHHPNNLNLAAKLSQDAEKYGAYPAGIPEGTPFTEFFGKQWGSLSARVGLDAIVLRDGFLGLSVYRRGGPWGLTAPVEPAKVAAWSKATADLVRQTKAANPKALVIGYSNGASAVADWRVNCFDLEAIAKEGCLDAWVDQTWSGAFGETGQRRGNNFWNYQTLGWTYQLAYLLGHAAVLADTKVRHYFLTEIFDAWEEWDIIHNAQERLRWSIWAYSHAAVKTPAGLKMPAGSYISWANQGKKLLSPEDVEFLARTSNDAFRDARNTTEVFGPTLVYCRSAMEWQSQNKPADSIKEWIDEQAGTLMKWSVPIQSITRSEYLPSVTSDMFLFQSPAHLNPQEKAAIISALKSGKPAGVFASPAGGLDADIAKILGVSTKDKTTGNDIRFIGTLGYRTDGIYQSLPNTFPLFQPFTRNQFANGLETIYSVAGSPCLGCNQSEGKQLVFWDPPEFSMNLPVGFRGEYGTSLDQILGSPVPYVLAARLINKTLEKADAVHVSEIQENHSVTLAMWQVKDGGCKILAGNLEEGITHTADLSSSVTLHLPQSVGNKLTGLKDEWSGMRTLTGPDGNGGIPVSLKHGQTQLFTLRQPPAANAVVQ